MAVRLVDWRRWLRAGTLVAVIGCSSANVGASTPKLAVDVSLGAVNGQPTLEFSIRSQWSRPITLEKRDLPWECPVSILILAETYQPGRWTMELPLRSPAMTHPCATGKLKLDPGKAASGTVRLDAYFDDLTEVLAKNNVVVFWCWRPKVEGQSETALGGYQVIRGAAAPHETSQQGVQVDSYALDEGGPSLGLRLRNDTDENVSIDFDELPWLQGGRIAVRAGVLDPPRPLESVLADTHRRNPRAWVTLPPRGFIWGDIPLVGRVMGFDAARAAQDVIVFWFSEIKEASGGRTLGNRGGFVVFPKEKGE